MSPFQYERRMDWVLTPMAWAISFTDSSAGFIPLLSLGNAHGGSDHTVMPC